MLFYYVKYSDRIYRAVRTVSSLQIRGQFYTVYIIARLCVRAPLCSLYTRARALFAFVDCGQTGETATVVVATSTRQCSPWGIRDDGSRVAPSSLELSSAIPTTVSSRAASMLMMLPSAKRDNDGRSTPLHWGPLSRDIPSRLAGNQNITRRPKAGTRVVQTCVRVHARAWFHADTLGECSCRRIAIPK